MPVNLDFDPLSWTLSDDVLAFLPIVPDTYRLRGRFKKVCNNARLPDNVELNIQPLGGVSKGAMQELLFQQQSMIKKMLALQLASLQLIEKDAQVFLSCQQRETPEHLQLAELILSQTAQMFHYFSLVKEKRNVQQVSFMTGEAYKPKRDGNTPVPFEPVDEAKRIVKSRDLVNKGRNGRSNQTRRNFRPRNGRGRFTSYRTDQPQQTTENSRAAKSRVFRHQYRSRGRGKFYNPSTTKP